MYNRRYTGSKYKLMEWIRTLITDNCEGKTFFDVFAGTGVVTEYMINDYEKYIINDFLYSNEVIYKGFLLQEEYDMDKLIKIVGTYNKTNKTKLKDNGFDYHFNKLSGLRKTLVNFGKIFPYIPPIGLIVNIGFSTWVIMFMISYLIKRKNYKEILIFSPSIVAFMVCIASPVNTYFRYALPNVFAMTLLIGLFISIIKKKEVKNER